MKRKEEKITSAKMRERGFIDGYTGSKSKENSFIIRFCKKNMNINIIAEYIESYRTGYQIGIYTSQNLEGVELKNGNVSYSGKIIKEVVDKEQLQEKIKTLTPKKKKGR